MPTSTITVDDASSIFNWSPPSAWIPATSNHDRFISSYYQGTAMATNTTNATVSFTFFGNSIKIYGGKRGNHGPFQVQVDDKVYDEQDGFAPDPGVFQWMMFSANASDGLKDDHHNVTVSNRGAAAFLDIDFVTWETECGNPGEGVLVGTVQDTSETIKYSPSGGDWKTTPDNLGTYSGGTGHVSTQVGSTIEYSFTGCAIALYGPVDPNGAPYSVQFDEESAQNFSILTSRYIPQSLLYYRGGIKQGTHMIKVTHKGDAASGKALAIDYINLFTTPSLDATASTGLGPTAIAAITVGTIAFLVLFLITAFYYVRRGPKRDQTQSRLAKFFSFSWWKYGKTDMLDGAKRVTKRKGKKALDLNGSVRYAAVGAPDRDTEYLLPEYGPPGAEGGVGGTARNGPAGGTDEMGRTSAHLAALSDSSRATSYSTIGSARHTKQQSSLSGLSVLNQPLMRPQSVVASGMEDAGSSGAGQRQLSPPPEVTVRTTSSATPGSPTITNPFAPPQARPQWNTSPGPSTDHNRRPPGADAQSTVLLIQPQPTLLPTPQPPLVPAQPQTNLQRKQTVLPPLPPGAATPMSRIELPHGFGERTSTSSTTRVGGGRVRSSGSIVGAGTVGGSGTGGKGSGGVIGPRVRAGSSVGSRTSLSMIKKRDDVPPEYHR
ncbi:hypothetical protein P691DRAFT_579221 [Macrolepiota fuliginosa MF-IS2]|uniref:Transmembrane protein n=1 Tax=Macrolepiota fuliginosa MF-IS2 TaxID=1400762 RepID=A0A9P5XQ16_9AGAR|nr:hypothetical protein P691DRAFT_579221 [Macrolepiota fuliginosa MF-IS2]